MPRGRPALDPDNPQHAFAARLQQLHRHAGKPKQKTLAGALFCSGPRISAFLTGRDFPDWQYVERFVRFCGGNMDEFQKLWEETDEQLERLRHTGWPHEPSPRTTTPITASSRQGSPPTQPKYHNDAAPSEETSASYGNDSGNPDEPRPGVWTRRSAGYLPQSGVSHLVLIGSGNYEHASLPALPVVRNNLADLKKVFTDAAVSDLQPRDITVCLDPRSMIDFGDALSGPADTATDLLLVYFSGHGLVNSQGDLYLAIGPTDPSRPNWTAVPMEAIRATVRDSPARNRVLILDCCFSGRAIQALADGDSVIYGQTEVSGVCTITSTSPNRTAVMLPGDSHTAFTGELFALLSDGIPGGPEFLSLGVIRRRLVQALRTKGLPTPQTHGTDTVDLLDLVRNRAWQPDADPEL
jgi:hypothetical protein